MVRTEFTLVLAPVRPLGADFVEPVERSFDPGRRRTGLRTMAPEVDGTHRIATVNVFAQSPEACAGRATPTIPEFHAPSRLFA